MIQSSLKFKLSGYTKEDLSKRMKVSFLERMHCLKYPSLSNSPSECVLVSFISESAQWGKQQRRAVGVVDVHCIPSDCYAVSVLRFHAGHCLSLNFAFFPWLRVLFSWPDQLSGFHVSL